jgi:hypothetical protein
MRRLSNMRNVRGMAGGKFWTELQVTKTVQWKNFEEMTLSVPSKWPNWQYKNSITRGNLMPMKKGNVFNSGSCLMKIKGPWYLPTHSLDAPTISSLAFGIHRMNMEYSTP